jgi:hypothetical protein
MADTDKHTGLSESGSDLKIEKLMVVKTPKGEWKYMNVS